MCYGDWGLVLLATRLYSYSSLTLDLAAVINILPILILLYKRHTTSAKSKLDKLERQMLDTLETLDMNTSRLYSRSLYTSIYIYSI